jgi:hypothetical protein
MKRTALLILTLLYCCLLLPAAASQYEPNAELLSISNNQDSGEQRSSADASDGAELASTGQAFSHHNRHSGQLVSHAHLIALGSFSSSVIRAPPQY